MNKTEAINLSGQQSKLHVDFSTHDDCPYKRNSFWCRRCHNLDIKCLETGSGVKYVCNNCGFSAFIVGGPTSVLDTWLETGHAPTEIGNLVSWREGCKSKNSTFGQDDCEVWSVTVLQDGTAITYCIHK